MTTPSDAVEKKSTLAGRFHKLRGFVDNGPTQTPSKRRLVIAHPTKSRDASSLCVGEIVAKLNNQSVSLYRVGDFLSSLTSFRKALVYYREVLLSSSVNKKVTCTATRRASTAVYHDGPSPSSYIYQRTDLDEGMDAYSDTELIQSDDHPHAVLAALFFNVGQTRRKLRDLQGAADNYYDALDIFLPADRYVPENTDYVSSLNKVNTVHRIVIPILHNIGRLAYRQGRHEEAKAAFEVALRHCRQLNGKDDISVGTTLNCLGVIYYHNSKDSSDSALQAFEESMLIQTRFFGQDATAVATTLNNLGRVYIQRKEYKKALSHYERALTIRRTRLGPDSIDYAVTAFNTGQSFHMTGDHERAITLYNEFLRVAKTKLSRNHRDVAIVLSSLAQIHQARNECDKALALFEESISVGKHALGCCHSEVAMLFNRIGNFHFEQDNFDAALVAYQEGLRIETNIMKKKSDPNIITTLSNIGDIYMHLNEYNKAIEQYGEILSLQKECYGPNNEHVASTLNILGTIHDEVGNADLALLYLQQALDMRRDVLGDDHLDVSETLTHLGTIFYRRNAFSTALKLFNESLRIRVDKVGSDNSDVSFTMYNMGLCHQQQGNHDDTIKCFEETLRIERVVLGEDHKDVSVTMFNLGKAYESAENFSKALGYFEGALRIERSRIDRNDSCCGSSSVVVGEEDLTTVAQTLHGIGNIYLAKGEIRPMMEAFAEAMRISRSVGYMLSSDNNFSVCHHLYDLRHSLLSSAAAAA